MRTRVEISSLSGLVVLHDRSVELPSREAKEPELRKALSAGATAGKWFYLDAEDTVRYRLDVWVEEQPEQLPSHRFQNLGGTFRLQLETGRLVVSGLEAQGTEPAVVDVEPGTYALTVRGPGAFDGRAYRAEREELLGASDVRYQERVDRLGLLGCGGTVAAAASLLVPAVRGNFWVPVVGMLLAWTPHLVRTRLPRYRGIERRLREYEATLPHFSIQLARVDPAVAIVGGHLDVG